MLTWRCVLATLALATTSRICVANAEATLEDSDALEATCTSSGGAAVAHCQQVRSVSLLQSAVKRDKSAAGDQPLHRSKAAATEAGHAAAETPKTQPLEVSWATAAKAAASVAATDGDPSSQITTAPVVVEGVSTSALTAAVEALKHHARRMHGHAMLYAGRIAVGDSSAILSTFVMFVLLMLLVLAGVAIMVPDVGEKLGAKLNLKPAIQQQGSPAMEYRQTPTAAQQMAYDDYSGRRNSRLLTPMSGESPAPSPQNSFKTLPEKPSLPPPLCPQLVVPPQRESSLLVPSALDEQPGRITTAQLLTHDKTPVFQCAIGAISPHAPGPFGIKGPAGTRIIALSSGNNEALLACARMKQSGRSLSIHDNMDRYYGSLDIVDGPLGGAFNLTFSSGARPVTFRSDGAFGSLSAKSEDGTPLAIVEPPMDPSEAQGPRSVVIGPNVDAGLMVLCLLGIVWLRQDTGRAL
eukprot:TRINITY_DN3058_c0_g1_i1.p1 TRINITY_DN3058_c0_g1~~TRINITY_DN3058_c0_g1_i1.p1  ORF type:complete len:466 (-),score=78.66 TRINITY_DN3058_c0_g1_i1:37-1434(-)